MSRQSRQSPHVLRPVAWSSTDWWTVIGLVLALIGLVIGWLQLASEWTVLKKDSPLEARIANLSSTLSDAARTVDEAEREIRARQVLVERLRKDQQRYEQLKRLDQAQVDAIAATLQGQLDEAERKARLATWLLLPSWGAVLGLLFTLVYAKVSARRRPTPLQSEGDGGNAPPS